ncbi:hypothetical protein T069G_04747 [Trichoderma breve]|uniref:Uncharacterized protein n=1 Tax=Trichoderma breve TaxID=2034170 RepID=A0A9W9E6C1_9HYPO|nr:hypothetical protein T069G_04747 [Trichoderma breve]KAJ4859759.1 hypothetical protein T069G_04747 [Trichoderma breve]
MASIAVNMKFITLLASVAAAQVQTSPIRPSHDSAKANANHIFNAIHSAGRQWGSSLNHNGFGFIPVVVPAGTLLYHGGYFEDPPDRFEWLAFEVEHAENFVRVPNRGRVGCGDEQPHPPSSDQKLLGQPETGPGDCEEGRVRGYLQTYQTTRDVRLLYLDGTSAGKSPMGTLDSQDEVLCPSNDSDRGFGGEMYRAKCLCDLVTEWGWDGIMRMEIGFEAIYCNFSAGLHLDSSVRTIIPEERLKPDGYMITYLWSRAAAERYDDIGGDRVQMDFSSMISGFFFPINVSNTDPDRPDLIRLGAAKREHLKDIKTYIQSAVEEPKKFNVNWQAVVDMIITRFSKRLAAMASTNVSTDLFIGELEGAIMTYLEAPRLPGDITVAEDDDGKNRTAEAVDRCASHYLKPALLSQKDWTLSDSLIHTALGVASPDVEADAYFIKRDVKKDLAWTTWKKPQLCDVDQILLTAMWPFGDSVDHFNPGCVSVQNVTARRRNYWTPHERRPFTY